MEQSLKMFLGKVLGEVYKIQYDNDESKCSVDKAKIYGLLNGIEPVVNSIMNEIDIITQDDIKIVTNILEPIFRDINIYEKYGGFHIMLNELEKQGINKSKSLTIFTYLKSNCQFVNFFDKIMCTQLTPLAFKELETEL